MWIFLLHLNENVFIILFDNLIVTWLNVNQKWHFNFNTQVHESYSGVGFFVVVVLVYKPYCSIPFLTYLGHHTSLADIYLQYQDILYFLMFSHSLA